MDVTLARKKGWSDAVIGCSRNSWDGAPLITCTTSIQWYHVGIYVFYMYIHSHIIENCCHMNTIKPHKHKKPYEHEHKYQMNIKDPPLPHGLLEDFITHQPGSFSDNAVYYLNLHLQKANYAELLAL